jgi:ribosome-binding factor A
MPRPRPRQAPRHYPRVARVNEVVLEALAEELADLQVADVYYSVLGTAEEGVETAAALESAQPRLRTVLGRHVRMKYLPELRFREDPSVAGGQRIDSLLRELHSDDDPVDDTPDRRRKKDRR